MTPTTTPAQPEALRLAEMLEDAPLWESQAPTIAGFRADDDNTLGDAAAELRRLHAQVAALTAAPGVQADDFQQFTTPDEGLNTLLNETFNMARGPKHNNMDTVMAWDEALQAVLTRLAPAQPAEGAAGAALPGLFREALAWGMTYGPAIPAHQWDEMRESMVKQYTERASSAQAPAGAAVVDQIQGNMRDKSACSAPVIDKPAPTAQPAPANVLHLVHDAFAEVAMAFPKAFALHKVGIADTAVREALAAPATQQAGDGELSRLLIEAKTHLNAAMSDYQLKDMSRKAVSELSQARLALAQASEIATCTLQPTPAAQQRDALADERERICAAIKAEDDYCVTEGDYMLDSDDCIKIVRGEWVRPDYSIDRAALAQKEGAK